jgi:hypothetical protein
LKFPTKIDCYMIVIKDNEASEYYANYCTKRWEVFGLHVKRFDAIVPADLKNLTELRWTQYSMSKKYLKRNLKAEITDTEKSCFYSHYMLWKKCIEQNVPFMILEHDSYLEKPENLWYNSKYGIIFFDKAATGSYIIFPWFAQKIVKRLETATITSGLYAFIAAFAYSERLQNKVVNSMHEKYLPASNQVMSEKYGNTIEHFCTSNRDFFKKQQFHKFKKI